MAKSTQLVTDCTTLANGTFDATSQGNATNPATNELMDLKGNATLLLRKAQELKTLSLAMLGVVDSGDPLYATLQGINQVCV